MKKSIIFAVPFGEMLEWLKRHAWKACVLQKGIKGSNPFLSAKRYQKVRTSLLDPDFLVAYCTAPPQAGRDVGA